MNQLTKHLLFCMIVLELVGHCCVADEATSSEPQAESFVHPGLLHTSDELAFIQQRIESNQQPWTSAWEQLQAAEVASLEYEPKPFVEVVRGVRNNPDIGSSNMSSDAAAAYAHALQWSLTQKEAHAEKAIEIFDAWTGTLQSVSGHDARLLVGMDGVAFCNAAELIRHTSDLWPLAGQERFERMLRSVFYPVIEDFYPTANGNWDASMIQTMIAMGIYLDDRAMFQRAVDYYRQGEGNGAIGNYFNDLGQCQESGRDQAHVQMGIGFLGCGCEMAWKQGVDLYGEMANRLALGFEYTAKYNLGEDVPYKRFRSVEGRYDYRTISERGRGRFRPIYERIVHHYHNRIGLDMPYSRRVAEQQRPDGVHRQHMSWSTLTAFGLPVQHAYTSGAASAKDATAKAARQGPQILGRGVGRFTLGQQIASDDFTNLDNWVVQIQERSAADDITAKTRQASVEARNRSLDCYLPGRGCTVWFKQKLPPRVTITYDIVCPTPKTAIKGLQPRDINNFWMATDPLDPDLGLFDSTRYTGKFSTYNKIHGYYASTGGGGNRTTRMRRYPREVDGAPGEHLALTDKDDNPEFMITPDKLTTVQLVAFDDVIQYIVDGKLVYEIASGDTVQVEGRDRQGRQIMEKVVYSPGRFPVYRDGYFGFRMVGTHHVYSSFRVFALEPANK
ncbi:MAG: hypothetical protein Aurels2KO_34380 [Aureliella sp.]